MAKRKVEPLPDIYESVRRRFAEAYKKAGENPDPNLEKITYAWKRASGDDIRDALTTLVEAQTLQLKLVRELRDTLLRLEKEVTKKGIGNTIPFSCTNEPKV